MSANEDLLKKNIDLDDSDIHSVVYPDVIRINTPSHVNSKSSAQYYWNEKERHQWMVALFVGCTALYLTRAIMPICSVQISNELHLDRTKTGTILGAFFWGYIMTPFIGGYLADLIGGESVVTIAGFGWGSVTLFFPFLPKLFSNTDMAYPIFLLARVALGFFQGFHFASIGSLMSQRVIPNQRQFTFSFLTSGSHLGTLMCGSVGSYLMETVGWRIPFILSGFVGLIWTVISRHILVKTSSRVISYSFNSPTLNTDGAQPIPWSILMSNPAFWAMLVGHFAHGNSYYILLSWLPSYFHDNFPDATSWVFNVVPWMITIPSVLFSGWLGDRFMTKGVSPTKVRKFMTTVSLLGTAFFLFVLSYVTTYYSALICMALAICCCGFHNSGITLNPQDIAPKYGGAVFGLMNMVGAIPGFLGVYIAGYILETTKSWSMVFNQTSILCAFGWVIYMIFGTAKQII